MRTTLARIALIVRDYDEAIDWYGRCLGFDLLCDEDRGGGKRWVVMASPGGNGAELLLAKAVNAEQSARVGDQTGGRVFLFLETDNLDAMRTRMEAAGVDFEEPTRCEAYGKVAVFNDLYGNRWDLIEPANA